MRPSPAELHLIPAPLGESMNVSDVYSHPLFNPMVDKLTGYRTRSLLCCPIRDLSGKNVAVLQVWNPPSTKGVELNLDQKVRLAEVLYTLLLK